MPGLLEGPGRKEGKADNFSKKFKGQLISE
jgi:hypothetical protein